MDLTYSRAETICNGFEKRLTGAYRKELFFNLVRNLLLTFLSFFIAGYVFVLLETVFHFRSSIRTVIFLSYSVTFLATFFYFVINFGLKRFGIVKSFDYIKYAGRIGNYFDDIKDSIGNSLSLFKMAGKKNFNRLYYSENLVLANLEKTNQNTKNINLSSFIRYGKLKKTFYVFLLSVFISVLSFGIFPSTLFGSLERLINYRYSYIDNTLGIAFEITPGNFETFKGDRINVTIKLKSTKPGFKTEEIEFFTKQYAKDGYEILSDSKELKSTGDNLFYTTIENVNTDLVYYAEYKEIRSEEYKIKISDYPILKNFHITIYPPSYTGLPEKKLNENEGDIYCIEGSKIYFNIDASKELSYAGIILNDKNSDLKVQGDRAEGTIEATEEGNYKIKLKDKDGRESRNEKIFSIKLLKNDPPQISIVEPQDNNYFVKGERDLMLKARIKDDYGFSRLTLFYRKSKSNTSAAQNFNSLNIPIKNLDARELEVPYLWDIKNLNLHSGDIVEYYMEVTDNSGKTGKSEIRLLTMKSLSEMLKQTEDVTKNIEENLKSIFDDIKKLNEEIKELKKNNTEELGLNDPQKKLDLQKKIENLQNNMDATQQKMEKGMNDLQQKNMLSEKTLEQFMKLQEMFSKIDTPQFRDMLKKMMDSLKKDDMNQLREEMKNYHFDEEAFKKQIDQLMKMMQKIENLQKFGELTQKLDDIKKEQEELKSQTENTKNEETGKMNTLANRQQDIKEQMQNYKDELQKLIDELNKMKEDISPNDLQKLSNKMKQKNTDSKMQKSSNELMKGQKKNAEDTQQDIMNDLNDMNNDMQDALESAMDSQNMQKKMQDEIERLKNNIEKLSKDQQKLKEKTQDIKKNNKNEFQESGKEQGDLKQELTKDINDLMNMTNEGMQMSPELGKELGNAYNKMDRAEGNLQNGEKENAVSDQGKAKESLDNAAKMLGNMLGQMKQEGKNEKRSGQAGAVNATTRKADCTPAGRKRADAKNGAKRKNRKGRQRRKRGNATCRKTTGGKIENGTGRNT